ncbi:MAG: hypothetical protein WCW52_06740 [Elusimicrobiales bacterium]
MKKVLFVAAVLFMAGSKAQGVVIAPWSYPPAGPFVPEGQSATAIAARAEYELADGGARLFGVLPSEGLLQLTACKDLLSLAVKDVAASVPASAAPDKDLHASAELLETMSGTLVTMAETYLRTVDPITPEQKKLLNKISDLAGELGSNALSLAIKTQ